MITIGILGDIGSGKSFVAKNFGYPVFNADDEVSKLYSKDIKIYKKLKKILPKYFYSFPVNKNQISKAILAHDNNLNKIVKIVHAEVRKKLKNFLKKNRFKENCYFRYTTFIRKKIYNKKTILIFVESRKSDIKKRLIRRKNFNQKIYNKFKKIQLPLDYKKRNLIIF